MTVRNAELVFLLDLDRTMANTKLYELAEMVLQTIPGVKYEELRRARSALEATGGSFDFVQYLAQQGIPSAEFTKRFVVRAHANGSESYRQAGATDLIVKLERRGIPYVFMTYGGSEWQYAKLIAAGYDFAPSIITSTKYKGREIASWWVENEGRFIVAGDDIHARRVVLVDDKFKAFSDLPSQARGYWFTQNTQEIELASNVCRISVLAEISMTDGFLA